MARLPNDLTGKIPSRRAGTQDLTPNLLICRNQGDPSASGVQLRHTAPSGACKGPRGEGVVCLARWKNHLEDGRADAAPRAGPEADGVTGVLRVRGHSPRPP